MLHLPQRRRLGSVGDSAPPSDSSEGTASETYEVHPDWTLGDGKNNQNLNTNRQVYLNDSDADCDAVSIASTILSPEERSQIESFFAGLGTEIYVSSSLANLYEAFGKDNWRLIYTGIPVLLYDKGSARSRATPRITFCLAERGSCFALWRDSINSLSQYRVAGPAFHTMCLSSNHKQVFGFSFDSSDSARELWREIEKLINSPENVALHNSVSDRKKQKQKKMKPVPLPPKSQISHPCQFHHVTSVTKEDAERYYSLQAFVASSSSNRHRQ